MENLDTTIWGGIISVALLINAFFIKELVKAINEMKVSLAVVTTQHDGTVADVKDNKTRIFHAEQEQNKIKERLHSLEGGQLQTAHFIEQYNKSH